VHRKRILGGDVNDYLFCDRDWQRKESSVISDNAKGRFSASSKDASRRNEIGWTSAKRGRGFRLLGRGKEKKKNVPIRHVKNRIAKGGGAEGKIKEKIRCGPTRRGGREGGSTEGHRQFSTRDRLALSYRRKERGREIQLSSASKGKYAFYLLEEIGRGFTSAEMGEGRGRERY